MKQSSMKIIQFESDNVRLRRVEIESNIIPVTSEVDPRSLSIEISALEPWSFLSDECAGSLAILYYRLGKLLYPR